MDVPPPRVSVLMLTHNHAEFLQQAIDSVRAQTLQDWELLIGEDASSDITATIAHQAAVADLRISVFTSPEGALGFHQNFSRLLAAAQAPYVAFLEGDDWWSDPCKLERQVALLEQDASLAFCGGRTRVLDQRTNSGPHSASIGPLAGRERLAMADLISSYNFHFSSVLMRRHAVELPRWIFSQYCLDRPLYLLAARHGDAGIIPFELSVYRLHGGGVWAPLSPVEKARRSQQLFTEFKCHFRDQSPLLSRTLSRILWSYLADALDSHQRQSAAVIFLTAVQAAPVMRLVRELPLTLAVVRRLLLSI